MKKSIMRLVDGRGYFISKKIGLTAATTSIAAAGTSCRHQILMEQTEKQHPVKF
jgi:malate/lactate dehydrogenase